MAGGANVTTEGLVLLGILLLALGMVLADAHEHPEEYRRGFDDDE